MPTASQNISNGYITNICTNVSTSIMNYIIITYNVLLILSIFVLVEYSNTTNIVLLASAEILYFIVFWMDLVSSEISVDSMLSSVTYICLYGLCVAVWISLPPLSGLFAKWMFEASKGSNQAAVISLKDKILSTMFQHFTKILIEIQVLFGVTFVKEGRCANELIREIESSDIILRSKDLVNLINLLLPQILILFFF